MVLKTFAFVNNNDLFSCLVCCRLLFGYFVTNNMNSSKTTINCYVTNFSPRFCIFKYFEQYGGYKVRKLDDKQFSVDVENVTLNVTDQHRRLPHIDVCLVDGSWYGQIGSPEMIFKLLIQIGEPGDLDKLSVSSIENWCKYVASVCKDIHPNVPIILAGDPEWDSDNSNDLEKPKLRQWTGLSEKRRNELANEVGAIKFIRYSVKSGRGFKNLIDEIVCFGLEKLKKEKQLKDRLELVSSLSSRFHQLTIGINTWRLFARKFTQPRRFLRLVILRGIMLLVIYC